MAYSAVEARMELEVQASPVCCLFLVTYLPCCFSFLFVGFLVDFFFFFGLIGFCLVWDRRIRILTSI